jgi:hypothetical protein
VHDTIVAPYGYPPPWRGRVEYRFGLLRWVGDADRQSPRRCGTSRATRQTGPALLAGLALPAGSPGAPSTCVERRAPRLPGNNTASPPTQAARRGADGSAHAALSGWPGRTERRPCCGACGDPNPTASRSGPARRTLCSAPAGGRGKPGAAKAIGRSRVAQPRVAIVAPSLLIRQPESSGKPGLQVMPYCWRGALAKSPACATRGEAA